MFHAYSQTFLNRYVPLPYHTLSYPNHTRKLFSINFKGISNETSFLIFYSSQGMYIESTRKSRFPELGGKSNQHQLRMSWSRIRMVLQIRSLRRRERVRSRWTRLLDGGRRNVRQPTRWLRVRLQVRLHLRSRPERVCFQLRYPTNLARMERGVQCHRKEEHHRHDRQSDREIAR